MSEMIQSLTIEMIQNLMQGAGYRVEAVTDPVAGVSFLRSATNGLSFDLRMGNRMPSTPAGFSDAALVAVFNVVGEFPLAPINAWNNSRRFGRLQLDNSTADQKFLVLYMDVVVAGGVSKQYLRGQIEIWDGLVQQFAPWLRSEVAKLRPANNPAPESSATPEPAGQSSPADFAAIA